MALNPVGRSQLVRRAHVKLWPLARLLAACHRRTLSRGTRLLAVVGSFGKTTTTRAVAAAVGDRHPSFGPNNHSYLARAVLGIRPGRPHAVVEVGIAAPGQMAPYAAMLRPDFCRGHLGGQRARSLLG
jgi:UDP-N-acetylmuramyl pentapeptide synthase